MGTDHTHRFHEDPLYFKLVHQGGNFRMAVVTNSNQTLNGIESDEWISLS